MAELALSRLRVTQALPISYRMLGGESPQLSRREAGSRTDLVLTEASGWDCTRVQPEPDSGSACRSCPQRMGQLWTTPSELVPSCFLRPASMWSESRLHFLPAVGSPAGRFNLCVRVSASSFFFFFFFAGKCTGVEQFFRPVLVQWPLCCVIQPLSAVRDHQLRGLPSHAACYDFTCGISPFFVQTSP